MQIKQTEHGPMGPKAQASYDRAVLEQVTTPRDFCAKKVSTLNGSLRACGLPCVYLTQEQAAQARRGVYSGWYHQNPAPQSHLPVPKRWVS